MPRIAYKPHKNDAVDEMIGEFLNREQVSVRIKRLGDGYYKFGTKKIFAKIINGKLVIRVGGGYMTIEEFVKFYGQHELTKMAKHQQHLDQSDDELNSSRLSDTLNSSIRSNKTTRSNFFHLICRLRFVEKG